MDMFKIVYDARTKEDVFRLSKSTKERVRKAIEGKLQISPKVFGKPLRYSLRDFRSLRVGEYRSVFLLSGNEVLILLIAHRRDVYERIKKRF